MAINAHTHTLQVIIIVHSYMLVIPTSHKLTLVQRPNGKAYQKQQLPHYI